MKGKVQITFLFLSICLVLASAGCVSGDADDPSGPDVELQVVITESPPVSAQDQEGVCEMRITEWTVSFTNVPKNALANTSPWNDVEIESITITYDFPDVPAFVTTRTIPTPGTVAAEGTQTIKFEPILFQDLTDNPGLLGVSGILTLSVRARTTDNIVIWKTIGEVLNIEQCL